jgi:hypothetical protein
VTLGPRHVDQLGVKNGAADAVRQSRRIRGAYQRLNQLDASSQGSAQQAA